jgi:hypothetical protein
MNIEHRTSNAEHRTVRQSAGEFIRRSAFDVFTVFPMRSSRRQSGKSALDLVEEAVHLLRAAPAATLATHGWGTIPFVLGLLYFWADMSRSPFAHQHVAGASLGMAALFLWMKFWQAAFAARVRAQAAGLPAPRWGPGRCARVFLGQAIVQPSGLFLLPLALIPVLPFGWVYAFYQSATALAGREPGRTSRLAQQAWKQAALWPRQNHVLLALLAGWTLCVFLNWTIICYLVPQLVKMLLGIESAFTRSPAALLNTTFFTAMLGLTYLCVDPVLKTIYVLRCFYGESLESGEDLKAALKPFAGAAQTLAVAVALLGALGLTQAANASAAPLPKGTNRVTAVADFVPLNPSSPPAEPDGRTAVSPVSRPAVSPAELDRAISDTLRERKYTWRMPREAVPEPEGEPGILGRFLQKAGALIREWWKTLGEWLRRLLERLFRHEASPHAPGGWGWIMSLNTLLYALLAIVVVALALLVCRLWIRGRQRQRVVASEAIQPAPDLADESAGAEQLPEDGWTKLARELLERGEFRLAMRAFYLASLAHLAQRNLISLARFKSNRDYERELRRRGHSFPDLLSVFDENLLAFERIWYGTHEATSALAGRFAANVDKIRGAV